MFGGSKPTMFRHFPTKRALLEAVVARIARGWTEQIDWRGIANDRPELWLCAVSRKVLRWILSDENIFVGRMAIAEGAAFPEIRDTYRNLAVRPIEAMVSDKLRTWTEAGVLNCADPDRDATSFLDLTVSGLVSRKLYHVVDELTDEQIDRHSAHAVGLFVNGRRSKSVPATTTSRGRGAPVVHGTDPSTA
jgi:AcrR family transcriptional regulator